MNEDAILSDRPSTAPTLAAYPMMALIMAGPLIVLPAVLLPPGWQVLSTILGLFGVLIILMAAWFGVSAYVEDKNTRYTLTAHYLMKESGILHHDQKVIPLEKVQIVTVMQPLMGRQLNYGTVVVQAAGFGGVRLRSVPKPKEWQKAILQALPSKVAAAPAEGVRRW